MNKEKAAMAWSDMWPELSERLGDVRPKLKDYEAHMIMMKARDAVLSVYEETDNPGVLRGAALSAFVGLPYKKTSKYFVEAMKS